MTKYQNIISYYTIIYFLIARKRCFGMYNETGIKRDYTVAVQW